MAEQYISIKVILDKIHRHPLLSDVSFETVIDYCIDFMRIVGVPSIFIDRVVQLELNHYKTALPEDFVDLIQIRIGSSPLRSATDSFHLSEHKQNNLLALNDTFIIQEGYIQSSIEKGLIEVAYRAINTDSEGFPMIPDNSNFTRALESFVKVKHYSILFDLGKITQQVLFKAEQDYAWAVGALETDARRLDLSKADAMFNSFRTLIIRDNEFNYGWANDGAKQILIRQ